MASKGRHALIRTAGLAMAAAACTQDVVQPIADCASLLAQLDQAVYTASAEQVELAAASREEGEKLCLEGETEEGAAKLKEAISQLSSPTL